MPYGHLIAATVMTLGVCQGCSSIASFSILTSASRGPSAIAEFLIMLALLRCVHCVTLETGLYGFAFLLTFDFSQLVLF